MSVTERLANLSFTTVIITIAILFLLRLILLKLKTPAAKSLAEVFESLAVAIGLVFLLIRPFVIQAFFIPSASMHPTLLERDHIIVNKFIYRFREPKRGDVVVFKSPPEAKKGGADFIKRVIAVPGDTVRITQGYVMIGNVQYSHQQLLDAEPEDVFRPGKLKPEGLLAKYAKPGGEWKVKLSDGKVFLDGVEVPKKEIAAAAGDPGAKVKIVPGLVYLNGRVLKESYTAEDSAMPYPFLDTNKEWIVTKKISGEPVRLVKIPKDRLLVMGDNRNDSNDARFWGLLKRNRVLGKAEFIFWPIARIRLVH